MRVESKSRIEFFFLFSPPFHNNLKGQFSSILLLMQVTNFEDLEKCKENIPLPSMSLLSGPGSDSVISVSKVALYSQMNPRELENEKNSFRTRMIVSAEDYFSKASEKDPLSDAFEYVEFLGKYYGASGKGNFKDWVSALEWITKKFVDEKDFHADSRLIKVWCWYAACCQDPEIVFQYMLSRDIGSSLAIFYESFAEFLGYQRKR